MTQFPRSIFVCYLMFFTQAEERASDVLISSIPNVPQICMLSQWPSQLFSGRKAQILSEIHQSWGQYFKAEKW